MVDGKWVERKPATRIHRGKVETTVHSVFRETLACFRRPVIALFFAHTYGTCFSLVRPSPRSRPIFSRGPWKSRDETPLVVDFDYGRRALRRGESIIQVHSGTRIYTATLRRLFCLNSRLKLSNLAIHATVRDDVCGSSRRKSSDYTDDDCKNSHFYQHD